jgi:hypothetical protein
MDASARMISQGVRPSVMRKRMTIDWVIARFSEARSVSPRLRTASSTSATVWVVAMCITTSSLTRLVSESAGMSMILRSRPGGRLRAAGLGDRGSDGIPTPPPGGMLTAGAVLSC